MMSLSAFLFALDIAADPALAIDDAVDLGTSLALTADDAAGDEESPEDGAMNSPDSGGETVVNKSSECVLIKTENTGFVILAPNATYTGENVPGYDYNEGENKIDGGKIDGVITSSGKILKVSDTKSLPKNVSVIVEDGDDDVEMNITADSAAANTTADMMKKLSNTFLMQEKELSGFYSIGDGSGAGDWISRAPTQDELKEMLGDAGSLFIAKCDMETYLNA